MPTLKLPILRRGDGLDFPSLREAVKQLQTKLKFAPAQIDGKFGPATENAVKSFQQQNKLTVDGIVGGATWSKLWRQPVEVFAPVRERAQGIDVSNFNGDGIDWQAVKNEKISFVFAKATQGETFRDKLFTSNWEKIKQAGIRRGAYHFFQPSRDPKKQVENFLGLVKLEPGDLPPVLDVEPFPAVIEKEWKAIVSPSDRISRIQQWLEMVQAQTKRRPIIYTNAYFWKDFLDDTQILTNYPLWIANYTTKPDPLVPANNWGGKGWTFWQYTEEGKVAGIKGLVDRNRFKGALQNLANL